MSNSKNAERLESFHLETNTAQSNGFIASFIRKVVGSATTNNTSDINGSNNVNQEPPEPAASSDSSASEIEHRQSEDSFSINDAASTVSSHIQQLWRNTPAVPSLAFLSTTQAAGINKKYWMKDEKVKECYDCKLNFNTFRRRHHCRICGQIFCHKCASSIVSGSRFGYQTELRVCNFCLLEPNDKAAHETHHATTLPSFDELGRNRYRSASISFPIPQDTSSMPGSTVGARTMSRPPSRPPSAGINQMKESPVSEFILDLPSAVSGSSVPRQMLSRSHAPFRKELENVEMAIEDVSKYAISPYLTDEGLPGSIAESWHHGPFSPINWEPSASDPNSPQTDSRRKTSDSKSFGFSPFFRQSVKSSSSSYLPPIHSELSVERADDKPANISALNLDLNSASQNHLALLLYQLLQQSGVQMAENWQKVILTMLLKVCSDLRPNIRGGDEIDLRNYVKIKRIPGGLISDSHLVSGVVATKQVIHKKMLKVLKKPRILLLTFALQYERVEKELISLEPLITQEREHIKNLVNRLVALSPDLIFVQKSISHIALEYLLEANITAIQNTKSSVLEFISRATQSDIIHSIDKLGMNPRIGTCKEFSFEQYTGDEIPGIRKTFIYLRGCEPQCVCTIVLRGASMEKLKLVKQIVDMMVFVVYSLKLETCLWQDQFAATPTTQNYLSPFEALNSLRNKSGDVLQAIRRCETLILSGSPHIQFPPPYLLINLHRKQIQASSAPVQNAAMPLASMEIKQPKGEESTDMSNIEDGEMSITINDTAQYVEASYLIELADSLSFFTQQNILVLFSNVCSGSTIPCLPHQEHMIEYYRDSDLTLGQFIEDTCYGSQFSCPIKSCDKPMLHHYRSYAHYDGRINVSVNSFPSPIAGMENCILMWSSCKICKQNTPFIPMSEETWKYSFGKYLELTFYHPHIYCRAITCTHDIHQDHFRYFAFNNLTVRIEYEQITLHEVFTPPMRRILNAGAIEKIRDGDVETLHGIISSYYDSILSRIDGFTFEVVSVVRQQAAREAMTELCKRAASEKKFLCQLLKQTTVSSLPLDRLCLNIVYKALQEKVQIWDNEFTEFVRIHLQSDPLDLRKATAKQFKRIFADRESSDVQAILSNSEPAAKAEDITYFMDKSKLPTLDVNPSLTNESNFQKMVDISRDFAIQSRELPLEGPSFPAVGSSPTKTYVQINYIPAALPPSNAPKDVLQNQQEVVNASDFDESTNGVMYPRIMPTPPIRRPKPGRQQVSIEEDFPAAGINTFSGVAANDDSPLSFSLKGPGERTSLIQTITNLWTGNLANFAPLAYPMYCYINYSTLKEHIFSDSLVIVREDEPSSIISYTMSVPPYKQALAYMRDDASDKLDLITSIGGIDVDDDIEDSMQRGTGMHIRYRNFNIT